MTSRIRQLCLPFFLILPLLLISCSSSVKIDGVLRGFFEEVNRSNFETAKAKYLSSMTISALNSPLTAGERVNANPQTYRRLGLAGSIQSVEVNDQQIRGESATANVALVTDWGGRYLGRAELIKEAGREWKISDLGKFERLGEEHANRGRDTCYPNNVDAADSAFQAAAAENPQDSLILAGWGQCYFKLGNLATAEVKYKKAIEMHP